jgi:PatG C-terminal
LYSFDRAELVKQLPRPQEIDEKVFQSAIKQTLDVVGRMSGNLGLSDAHRAINYLVARSAELYHLVARQLMENEPLSALSVSLSELSGSRRVYEVILTFRSRGTTAIRNFSAKVDTTNIFPFLVAPFSPYIERR